MLHFKPVFRPVAIFAAFLAVLIHISAADAKFVGKAEDNPRMATSSSPYLRSHSNDLVRWYKWGEAAFKRARDKKLPLFVSFGYTACHWCHVMQEKHFNDEAIAKTINEKFVPVLVDREQRTALDDTYMLVTELLTQRGGWPNNMFLTPDLKPFYGTGYIPPQDFTGLLKGVTDSWAQDNPAVVAEGDRLATLLEGYLNRQQEARNLTPTLMAEAARTLSGQFDPFAGGLGDGPRFFRPTVLAFMLQQAERGGDTGVLDAVERTLQSGLSGGIHDHIEGGFHRYAIDPGWRVPHFEKMLNDQALVAEVYLTAYRLTGKHEYAATARKTIDYVLADLTSPQGGFYTARDADSEGEEGTYYVWTPEQLETVLGKQDAEFSLNTFGLIADGDMAGKVILNMDSVRGQSVPQLDQILAKLAEARKPRQKPVRDEKILANWNGMMIASMAKAAILLDDATYRDAAVKAGDFIWTTMHDGDGVLQRSHFDGINDVEGELDDYAQVARGYLFVHDATGDKMWLDRAKTLLAQMRKNFQDTETGDFYGTREAAGFARTKPRSDVDQPSGNGAALDAMVRLAQRAGTPDVLRATEQTIAALSGIAAGTPTSGASILSASDSFLHGQTGVVQFAGNGVVTARLIPADDRKSLIIQLQVADGWHVNSHAPLEDYLVATKLDIAGNEVAKTASVSYPQPETKKLAFNEKPMALLENQVEITARFDKPVTGPVEARLQVQTCSDEICLLPETLKLRVALPPVS
ncbi:MAG: DUF255 domain-containing protein [Anderseniella sp.]